MTKTDLTQKVNFDMIRYANCWEDADILLAGLSPAPGSKILSIGSAGDNSFSFLVTDPELVVAVDINRTQLFLIELKKICIQNLEWEEALAFLGFLPSENRAQCFYSLKNQLSSAARAYWESNLALIAGGVIHQGKFERYFQLFSGRILPWIHSKRVVNALFERRTTEEQAHFYQNTWNTWRWRLLFRIFFSKYVMGRYGRDPEFQKQVQGSVSEFIFGKAAGHLASAAAQDNFILRYTLTGSFGGLLPHYLHQEHYPLIRANLGRLHWKEGFAQTAIGHYGKFHCMNLSDIFEYMDAGLFGETARTLVAGTEKDGRLGYWNLMVPRRISQIVPESVEYMETEAERLTAIDKGFFYNRFMLDKVVS
jgi:S-adenosylmethionine-diacylglycerol 3-amino-3-carboxypropyl transferase